MPSNVISISFLTSLTHQTWTKPSKIQTLHFIIGCAIFFLNIWCYALCLYYINGSIAMKVDSTYLGYWWCVCCLLLISIKSSIQKKNSFHIAYIACGSRWVQTSDIEITSPPLNQLRHTFSHSLTNKIQGINISVYIRCSFRLNQNYVLHCTIIKQQIR